MSKQVDERVVSMQFDNKQFESNVQTTISTLDKLKQRLKLDGATKGLENVDTAAKKVNLGGIGTAVETVQAKFSALQVMGVTALSNITNTAVNAGKRIASALTIDPIKTGFSEYETKIGAIQTIMSNTASKGTTMEDVTRVIGELNTYADKTIYNFAEMTRNIGTFTAAGVGLEESASAIQGIANLAASSGSTSQQASTAMYQLSQALAAGSVKLMDWNSVVNAGMGGEKFQEALKATARDHGVAVDQIIKKNGSFRESLQEGWITADILNETLNKFTVDGAKKYADSMMKAGKWTQAQADALIKEAQSMEDAATKVKTFTQLWDTLKESVQSGWSQSWEIIVGDFEEAKELFTEVSDTLGGLIGASADSRNKVLQGWKDMGGRAAIIDAIRNAFTGLRDAIKPVSEAFREIFPPITAQQLYAFSEGLKRLTQRFKMSETTADKVKRVFKGVFALLDIGVEAVKALFGGFKDLVGAVAPAGEGLLDLSAKAGDYIVKLRDSVKHSNFFVNVVEKIKSAISALADFFKPVIEGIKTFAQTVRESLSGIAERIQLRFSPLTTLGEIIKAAFLGIAAVVKKVAPWISTLASKIGDVFNNLMDNISSSLQGADYNTGFDILNGGIFAAIGLGISKFIKSAGDMLDNAGGFLDSIKDILGGVSDALGAFTETLKAEALKKIATAIAILAAALLVLSLIDSDKLTLSLTAVTALFTELMISMKLFTKMVDGKGLNSINKVARAMISMSAALLILAVAMKIMSTMSWKEVGVGLTVTVVSLAALVGAVNLLPDKKVKNAAKAIKTMSGALLVLAVAIRIMGGMSWKEMGVGLISMVVGLYALVGAVNLLPKNTTSKATGMIALATAMVILGAALKSMGSMSWAELGRGLAALAGSLVLITAALNFMPKNTVSIGIGLLAVTASLAILASALGKMGGMSWIEIGKGLAALGGSLAIIAIGVNCMKSALPGAAALLIVAAALAVFTPMLKILGSMSLAEIGKGLLTLAGIFVIVGLAGLLLQPLVPTILLLSASIALLGVGIAAMGVGVVTLAAGITALSVALSAGGGAIVVFVSSLIGLIPYLIKQIGIGIIELCKVIGGSAAAICEAVKVIILAVVDALVQCVPVIVDGVLVLVVKLIESLVKYTPVIVSGLFDFIIGVLNAIADRLPDLIQAGVNVIMALLQGCIDALKGIDPGVLVEGVIALGLLTALVAALAAIAAMVPAAMVGVLGLAALVTELALVLAAIGGLAQIPGLKWLVEEGGDFLQSIGKAIGQFLGGIIGGIAEGISSALPQIGLDLSAFMTNATPFIEGAKQLDSATFEGVQSLVSIILALTAANILEGLTSWFTGGSSLTKFGEELAAFAPHMKTYATIVKGIDSGAVVASANAAKALSEMAANIPNEGGVAAWFAGENSISKFGTDLVTLGESLKSFSDRVAGLNVEAVNTAVSAANGLVDLASKIPNEGGVAAWFAGENSIAKFGTDLVALGTGLKGFADQVIGIDAEAVTAASGAARSLAEMANTIPNEGGMVAWFTGDNSIAMFGNELVALGTGLKGFADQVKGIEPATVTAAASAGKALAEMANTIPNEGGVVAWFAGDNSIAKFGESLIALGAGLSGFSASVAGVNPANITAAANTAKSLAEMANTAPADTTAMVNFGNVLPTFATSLQGYFATAGAISMQAISMSSAAIATIKGIARDFNTAAVNSVASAIDKMTKALKGMSEITAETSTGFISTIMNLSNVSIDALQTAFDVSKYDVRDIGLAMTKTLKEGIEQCSEDLRLSGESSIGKFLEGLSGKEESAKSAILAVAKACAAATSGAQVDFVSAGGNMVKGFANGISINTYLAKAKASAMASAAAEAARKELDEHSPSKVGYEIGDFFGVAFVNAIGDYVAKAYEAGSGIAASAKNGLRDAVSGIADAINSDIDTQPTIRPVFDLSAVKSGASAINGMLTRSRTLSIDTQAVGVLSASMAKLQNGNGSSELLSAIKGLRKDMIDNPRNSYNINGINVTEGSDVAEAIATIVRAVKVEGRT